ncbi:MAG: heme lyase CcmF/NrfE family subunit [Gammaproteobacteria bacterium]|nr:MAG: heme lyase CcmF/NrfE family subunit [Gammaproteobacteria bacterium]UCH41543.1 MAG: heme lyase CcmF/NrfE family subunit [Gammaproteobacteria bacterium]
MVPEIGHFALIIALCIAFVQALVPLAGTSLGVQRWVATAVPAALAQLLFVGISYGCLTWAFLSHDFSVLYVAQNSNSELPLIYRISGVWGSHEGSLLLWALVLALWTGAVAVFTPNVPRGMRARVLAVLGLVSCGFLLFIILTSNPFERLLPAATQGRDLNPLLQDIGLAIHPPMLYLGYVGFAVAFAFSIAALISGQVDSAWARWSRPWTNVAWLFLTLGIALGSWWAYYELGWGGWWFWDPVENASFMPWLIGTALMHSLAITEKRGTFKAWTALLAIFAFALSLLGTFLVRSGVLTSVHAFASDPERGVFILGFLVLVVGGSLTLYAWRAPLLKSAAQTQLLSRDGALLLNNIFLAVVTSAILLGTLYPIAIDAMGGKISVGPPYFNLMFILLTAPLGVLMGIGMIVRWKSDSVARLKSKLWLPALLALTAAALLTWLLPVWYWAAFGGLAMAVWIAITVVLAIHERMRNRSLLSALRSTPAGFYGMLLGHLGIAVFIVGVTLTSLYNKEKDLRMAPGDTYSVAGYEFTFHGVRQFDIDNYVATRGGFSVRAEDGDFRVDLFPEKRIYRVQTMPMTEAAIDAGLTRDLFIALGEPLGEGGAWAVRIYYKPFVRWIWLGAIIMSIGGLFAASDRRYRRLARSPSRATDAVEQSR